jgi:hypothetical protein
MNNKPKLVKIEKEQEWVSWLHWVLINLVSFYLSAE